MLSSFEIAGSKAAALVACCLVWPSLVWAVTPPGWWNDPNRGTLARVYEKGSSANCRSEAEARQKAYDDGLATIRRGITTDTNVWSRMQLTGSEIFVEETQKDPNGRWHSWMLVSYPRDRFEIALQRAREPQKRIPVFVCPLAFGKESEEQFPDVVKRYKAMGYGNAIWQTVEDMLYEKGYEVVTAPSSQAKSMLEQIFGIAADSAPSGTVKLPDKVLLCNMNFFEVKTESLSWGTLARNSEYHAELLLELYEVTAPHSNVKIPSKGEARDKDLLAATQKAAKQAIDKLVERVRKQ